MFYGILRGPPYEIEICDGDRGSKWVAVPISQDGQRVVSVICELAGTEIDGLVMWEFSFAIDCISLDDGTEPFRTQDRQIAAPYIPDNVRPHIMDMVCECIKLLIEHVKPDYIYRVTKESAPGEKALLKHHMLTKTLENAGYSVLQEGTDQFGRRFWTMEC